MSSCFKATGNVCCSKWEKGTVLITINTEKMLGDWGKPITHILSLTVPGHLQSKHFPIPHFTGEETEESKPFAQ